MRTFLLTLSLIPVFASAVDNTMVNSDVDKIEFKKLPAIGASFKPGIEPGIVVALPDRQTHVIPGYRVQSQGIDFDIGISCKADLLDDCSTFIYSDDYLNRPVDVRYIQTSDRAFRTGEGARIGESWQQIIQRLAGKEIIYSANDSCVLLPSGWYACIDLMSVDRQFDLKERRLLPKKTARVDFYYKQ